MGGFVNALASVVAGYRTPQIAITAPSWAKGTQTLPDLGHDLIGPVLRYFTGEEYLNWFHLPDHFVYWSKAVTFAFVGMHPLRLVIFRRYIFIFGSLLYMRAFSVLATSLPDASPACQAQFGDPETGAYKEVGWDLAVPWALRRSVIVMTEPGMHITCGAPHASSGTPPPQGRDSCDDCLAAKSSRSCTSEILIMALWGTGDMVFSGHFTFITLCLMVFVTYCQPHTCTALGEVGCRFSRRLAHGIHWIALICIVSLPLPLCLERISCRRAGRRGLDWTQ